MTEQAKYLGEEPVSGDSKHLGLTKREYFAGLAMQALITNGRYLITEKDLSSAIKYTDALLEGLSKPIEP